MSKTVTALLIMAGVALALLAPATALSAAVKVPTVARYTMYQSDFGIGREYGNPYDPREVKVDALFNGPGGKTLTVPCYWSGDSWHVRFATGVQGDWSWRAVVRDSSGSRELPPTTLRVAGEPKPFAAVGYVGVEKGTRYFNTTEGGAFIPIGGNVAWGRLDEYDAWFAGLAKNGANFARVWSSFQGGFGLEGPESGGYPGLGRYSEENAASLDYVFTLAERLGIRILLAMGNYRELIDSDAWGTAGWPTNPYNSTNGGPLKKPAEMWTNPKAKELYKNRLRYIVARWGYSPSVFAWEFWNETDAPQAWVDEMGTYLKSIDPFGHMVSTTYGTPGIWALPSIDLTMTHMYKAGDSEDMSGAFKGDARDAMAFGKPHLLAEFGLDWRKPDGEYDPSGKATNFRHGLWSSFLSGAAGAGAIWWWDNYIEPQGLYGVYAPFAKFVRGVQWTKTTGPLDMGLESAEGGTYDLKLNPDGAWGKYAEAPYTVGRTAPDGGLSGFPGYLYGTGKAPWNKPVTLRLDAQKPTTMVIGVASVSADCRLVVSIDGKTVWTKEFKPRSGQGEWESSEYKAEWKMYQAVYNKEYEIAIPQGAHEVSMRLTAGDWISLNKVVLKDYTSSPGYLATGVVGPGFAALWLHDPMDTWKSAMENRLLPRVNGLKARLSGLDDGQYTAEWWDTKTGGIQQTVRVAVSGGTCVLDVPGFTGETACRLLRATDK